MNRKKKAPGILRWDVVIGALVIGGGLFLTMFLIIEGRHPSRTPVGVVTAALTVVPLPSVTPTSTTPPDEPISNPEEVPPPPVGEFALGSFVKISGTEGAGLRLRVNPGLDHEPVYLGMEDEIFKIDAGPQQADGYIWWFLVAPFDPDRNGWAVSNYLQPVEEP